MEILSFTLQELTDYFKNGFNRGAYHAGAAFREIFKTGNLSFLNSPEFESSARFTRQLEGRFTVTPGKVVEIFREDQLTKFITRLHDGLKIESVVIPMANHHTLCVSCQVGCKMGCKFCQTARMGFIRNLKPHEITGQLFNARFLLKQDIKNVVFMGMGEPLDNFDAVIQSLRIMNEQKGFDIAFRHITLSTAGITGKIRQLATMNLKGLRLAISINSANTETRSFLMPVNMKNDLQALKQTLISFPLSHRGSFLFEYILIKGINDSKADAMALADYIHPLPVRLNLIPYNTVDGVDFVSPDDKDMNKFAQILSDLDVFVIKRWSKGRALGAGCGQLGRQCQA